jgi:hypothetical protein
MLAFLADISHDLLVHGLPELGLLLASRGRDRAAPFASLFFKEHFSISEHFFLVVFILEAERDAASFRWDFGGDLRDLASMTNVSVTNDCPSLSRVRFTDKIIV